MLQSPESLAGTLLLLPNCGYLVSPRNELWLDDRLGAGDEVLEARAALAGGDWGTFSAENSLRTV